MANEKDLYHSDGNTSCNEVISQIGFKKNTGTDKYAEGKHGAKENTTINIQAGWTK